MLILHNARIRTLDENHPFASSMAIDHGRILHTCSDLSLVEAARPADRLVDLKGQTVWPGLTDAHLHLEHYALSLQLVDCETRTRAECVRRVQKRIEKTPPSEWVRGHGWNQNEWPDGFGCAAELDAVAPHHPVYLTAKSLHASWANSKALRLAGITARTPDPAGGLIQRDEKGNPTGILLESATGLVEAVLPPPGEASVAEGISDAQQHLWRMGITSVHDFDRARCFSALQLLHTNGQLKLRVVKSIPLEALDQAVSTGLRGGFGNEMLRIGAVKCFADGALGPQTAAMLEAYEGTSRSTGILLMNADQVYEAGKRASQAGLSLAVHAIGDRANREVLDGFDLLRSFEAWHHLPALRHRIEHVQLLHPSDIPRLADMIITASVQPIHATSDMYMADRYWGERSAGAYAYKSLLSRGAVLAFGSDAPVESPNPFLGIHAAVTRQRPNGAPGTEGWHPQQRLSLSQALHAYTTGPAYAAGLEKHLGRLAPGYHADMIVLSRDPFEMPAQSLHSIQPSATMVGGEWVWHTSDFNGV